MDKNFVGAGVKLSRTPLGIIGFFIIFVYALAVLNVAVAGGLSGEGERMIYAGFLVGFPCLVLLVFYHLVSKHHEKLYAPQEFRDETNFVRSMDPRLASLPYAAPNSCPMAGSLPREASYRVEGEAKSTMSDERENTYSSKRFVFLAHVITPCKSAGRSNYYDVFIYLVGHRREGGGGRENLDDVLETKFYFGPHWGDKVFDGSRVNGRIGVKTSAYGSFLCVCHVTFIDGDVVTLYRYVDFEMADYVAGWI